MDGKNNGVLKKKIEVNYVQKIKNHAKLYSKLETCWPVYTDNTHLFLDARQRAFRQFGEGLGVLEVAVRSLLHVREDVLGVLAPNFGSVKTEFDTYKREATGEFHLEKSGNG